MTTDSIAIWAEANRDHLTRDGKTKTVRLAAGEFSWRTRPPSVCTARATLSALPPGSASFQSGRWMPPTSRVAMP